MHMGLIEIFSELIIDSFMKFSGENGFGTPTPSKLWVDTHKKLRK